MSRLRVLFVNENIGGHATVHRLLEHHLAEHPDVDARFLHLPPPASWRRVAGAALPGLGRLDLDLAPLRAQLALSAVVRRRLLRLAAEVDVLHVYTQNAALLSADLLARHPSVIATDTTNRENAYRLPQRSPTRFTPAALRATIPFERAALRAASLVVPSSAWAGASVATYGVAPERIRVQPLGVDVTAPLPRATASRPTVAFLGTSMGRKGGWDLLDLHRADRLGGADLHLVTHDPVPATPGVEVTGDLRPGDPRLHELLARATVLAFPSRIDQAPNAVLEAMAAGLPVVAYRTAAVPEMVEDGVTGLLVEPGDVEGLGAALRSVVRDPALARRLGAAGRERACERYDVRRTTAAVVALLHEAAGA